jgi:hypothetical protein
MQRTKHAAVAEVILTFWSGGRINSAANLPDQAISDRFCPCLRGIERLE